MSTVAKNKLLTWLVLLLLIANAATIAFFWMNKTKHPPPPKGTPKDFLVKELQLDTKQQEQLEVLVKEHQQAARQLRVKIKEGKENFFALLKQPAVTDSTKNELSAVVSSYISQLDMLTLGHFQKVRNLCKPEQQVKFDEIINEVTTMIGQPGPPMGPGNGRSPGPGMPPPME
ncbi:MAG: periplasmic heavy metal sensor [Chitinophagaceae bacterium]|nr:periplasmic heavy metal sensor [Chitinophagaceae bacterium]